jgi:hypothetical protein
VANLSGVLGDMFRFVYSNVVCIGCIRKSKKSDNDSSNSELELSRPNRSNSLGYNKKTFIDENGEIRELNEDQNESKMFFSLSKVNNYFI